MRVAHSRLAACAPRTRSKNRDRKTVNKPSSDVELNLERQGSNPINEQRDSSPGKSASVVRGKSAFSAVESTLRTTSLVKHYGKRRVVDDVSLEVQKGEVVG